MSVNETIRGIGAIILIIGAAVGLFGYKIYRFLLALTGFFLGGLIGLIFFSSISSEYGVILLGFFLGACIGAWALPKIERLAIALSAGVIGAIISSVITLWDRAAYIYNPNYFYYALYNSNNLLMFILFSIIGWVLYKWAIILITAGDGASFMALGGTISGLWDAQYYPSALFGTFILGVVVQAYQERNTLKQNVPPSLTNLASKPFLSKYFKGSQPKQLPQSGPFPTRKPLPQREPFPSVRNQEQEPIIVDPFSYPRPIPKKSQLPNLRQSTQPNICQACMHENRFSAKFCNKCGSDLSIVSNICCACGHQNRTQARFCSSCGVGLGGARSSENTVIW